MIESLFKIKKPLVLTDCTIFIRLKYFEIGSTYLFTEVQQNKLEVFGDIWTKGSVIDKYNNIGYFSSYPYYELSSFDLPAFDDEISIIGYSDGVRYIVPSISINHTHTKYEESSFAAKFMFLNYKAI